MIAYDVSYAIYFLEVNMPKKAELRIPGKAIRLGNAVTCFRNRTTQAYELTSTQSDAVFHILRNHKRGVRVTSSMLMDWLSLSQSTVAGIVSRLEAKELIKKEISSDDSRINYLVPTEKGLKLDRALRESAVLTENILLNGMSEDEQLMFSDLLERAISNITEIKEGEGNENV